MRIGWSCISGARLVGKFFAHLGHFRLQNPTVADLGLQLGVKGVDLAAKALVQILGADLTIVAGQDGGQRRLRLNVGGLANSQPGNQFGLGDLFGFILFSFGDAGYA